MILQKTCSKCRFSATGSYDYILQFFDARIKGKTFRSRCKNCRREDARNIVRSDVQKAKRLDSHRRYNEKYKDVLAERATEWRKLKIESDPIFYRARVIFNGAKHRSKVNGLDFDLSVEFVYNLLLKKYCVCCGQTFDFSAENSNTIVFNRASLDRFDNNKGYTMDNVSAICYGCNKIKGAKSIEEYHNLILNTLRWIDAEINKRK